MVAREGLTVVARQEDARLRQEDAHRHLVIPTGIPTADRRGDMTIADRRGSARAVIAHMGIDHPAAVHRMSGLRTTVFLAIAAPLIGPSATAHRVTALQLIATQQTAHRVIVHLVIVHRVIGFRRIAFPVTVRPAIVSRESDPLVTVHQATVPMDAGMALHRVPMARGGRRDRVPMDAAMTAEMTAEMTVRDDRAPRFSGRPDDDGKRSYERRDDQGTRSSAPNRFRSDRPAQGRFRDRSERSPDRYRSGDERRQSSPRPRFGDSGPRSQRPNLQPEAEASTPPADDLIWGRHASQAALESGRPIHRIWCTPEMRSAPKFLQLLREAKTSGVLVEEVTWARLAQVTGGSVHQGIALQTAAADTLDLSALIEGCSELGEPPLLLALDGITDPHNLGAVVRSAEAMGAHGLVLPQRRSAGLTGSAAKVAAGAMEHLPVARVVNLNRSLEKLKDSGYRVIGLAAEGDVTLMDVDLEGPLVLVTGSEDQGLSLLTRRHCDQLVRIPLRGITPSLNASVATALCVYEVARRNWMKDIHGQAPSPPIVRPQMKTQEVSPPAPPLSEPPL